MKPLFGGKMHHNVDAPDTAATPLLPLGNTDNPESEMHVLSEEDFDNSASDLPPIQDFMASSTQQKEHAPLHEDGAVLPLEDSDDYVASPLFTAHERRSSRLVRAPVGRTKSVLLASRDIVFGHSLENEK